MALGSDHPSFPTVNLAGDLVFDRETPVPASPQAVWDWHERPGAFAALAPPDQKIVLHQIAPIREGTRTVFDLMIGFLPIRWVAEHRAVQPPRQFQDVQIQGPFARWIHTHRFEPSPDGGCLVRDHIEFRLPGGAAAALLFGRPVRRRLERAFDHREHVLRKALS